MIVPQFLLLLSLIASSYQSEFDSLLKDIVSWGTEDLKWQEHSEFGDIFEPAEQLIEDAGFQYELHHATTRDGYIVEMIHLINPLADETRLKRIPVILSHGFTQAAYNFVCQSVNESQPLEWPRKLSPKLDASRSSDRNLGFLLANNGYDVWLVTSRGCLASTRPNMKLHTRLSTHQPEFWRFSLDEQAKFDIPAHVNGVRELTRANKVIFIGYSQSTFTMLGHLSLFPNFAKKIHTFVAVAPITSMKHGSGLLRPIGAFTATFIPQALRDFPFLPIKLGRILTKLIFLVYKILPKLVRQIMAFVYNLIFGNNGFKAYDGLRLLGRNLRYPSSFRAFEHYMQLQFEEEMTHYNHGTGGNLIHYGTPLPPAYNLTNIEHDGIAIYMGTQDYLSDKKDNIKFINKLKCMKYQRSTRSIHSGTKLESHRLCFRKEYGYNDESANFALAKQANRPNTLVFQESQRSLRVYPFQLQERI